MSPDGIARVQRLIAWIASERPDLLGEDGSVSPTKLAEVTQPATNYWSDVLRLKKESFGAKSARAVEDSLKMPPLHLEGAAPPQAEAFVQIERADVAFSAGRGVLVFHEGQASALSFRRDFLRERGVRPHQAVVVDVAGRSMEPTIPDGAVILVDRADKAAGNGRIFAFRCDGELLVKRMHKVDGGYIAVSDNPDKSQYPDRFIAFDEEGKDFDMIGRAIWMGSNL